ncbi:hypothetical protein D3C78_1386770 [compost metagenome]
MPHLQNVGMFENRFRGQGIDVTAAALACVVHQNINATPSGRHFRHERLDAFAVGHVHSPGNDCLGVFGKQFTRFADGCLAAGADRDPCPFSGECPSNGQADAP